MPKDYDSRIDAATVHRNRIREIDIFLGDPQSERLVCAMQEPYPALIHLRAYASASQHGWDRVLPDEFLGGSAPSLQHLYLCSIFSPELPKLLTSATGLVDLTLLDCRWYIPPDTLFTCLAVLVNLKSFVIEFSDSILHPDPEHRFSQPLPPMRIVLPALTHFDFRWKSKYLDFLVARIDAPLLDSFCIAFDENGFSLDIDILQLGPFMRRTTCLQALNEAHLDLRVDGILVTSLPPARISDEGPGLRFPCKLQFMKPVLSSFFPSIYIVEYLYIYGLQYRSIFSWEDPVKDTQWVEIFQSFAAVKNLYLRKEVAQYIAPSLQDLVAERVTSVFPILECIFLEGLEPSGPVEEAIGQFVAARQLLGRPIAVSHWNEP
jgi:hypothetical protein